MIYYFYKLPENPPGKKLKTQSNRGLRATLIKGAQAPAKLLRSSGGDAISPICAP